MSEQYGTLWEMIDRRLEGLEKGQQEIKIDVAVIKASQIGYVDDMNGVKRTLHGNGKKGLVTEMALVWQKVAFIVVAGSSGVSIAGWLIMLLFKGK